MNSKGNWELQVDLSVYKFLNKIPRRDAERILIALEEFSDNPFAGDVQKMQGEDSVWRRRVGSYRIRYEVVMSEKVIHVYHAERRTSHTY